MSGKYEAFDKAMDRAIGDLEAGPPGKETLRQPVRRCPSHVRPLMRSVPLNLDGLPS